MYLNISIFNALCFYLISLEFDNMKRLVCFVIISMALAFFTSCGGNSGENKLLSNKDQANAITQSMPTIMVFPSDAMLQRMGCLKVIENQGTTSYERNYQNAFIKNKDIKFAIAAIQEEFAKAGFAMEDMEQQLKQINNNNAMDEMTDITMDSRTELINTVRPDYIVEIDYYLKTEPQSRNLNKSLTYSVRCLDVYTNKVVASVSKSNIVAESNADDVPSLIKQDFPSSIAEFKKQITDHLANLLANGVEITLRVTTKNTSGIKLDDYCGSDEIGEKINIWIKDNTVKQSSKMVKNTSTEMYFTNVRIFAKTKDGKKYTAYDFASDLKNEMKIGCSIDVKNKTQSLGDALIEILGRK